MQPTSCAQNSGSGPPPWLNSVQPPAVSRSSRGRSFRSLVGTVLTVVSAGSTRGFFAGCGPRIFATTRSRSSSLTVTTYWWPRSGSTENHIESSTRAAVRRLAVSAPLIMMLSVLMDVLKGGKESGLA